MMADGDGLFRQGLVQASAAMMADGDGDDGALLRQRLVQASEVIAMILVSGSEEARVLRFVACAACGAKALSSLRAACRMQSLHPARGAARCCLRVARKSTQAAQTVVDARLSDSS